MVYAFAGDKALEEVLLEYSDTSTTFVAAFYYASSDPCGTKIEAGIGSSDNLQFFERQVGDVYS